jgi:apolipoprotein N-acyltransferase
MALFPAALVVLLRRVRRRMTWIPVSLAAPLLWTGLEVLRGEVAFTGYPWYLVAHPLIALPGLASPGSIAGTYAVSFLVVLPSAMLADVLLVRPRRILSAGIAAAVLAAAFAAAPVLQPRAGESGTFRIAVVQTNLPQDNKLDWLLEQKIRDFARFLELTRLAAAVDPKPDLIVWPETMFPGKFLDPAAVAEEKRTQLIFTSEGRPTYADFHDPLLALQAEIAIPMLVGAIGADNVHVRPGDKAPRPDAVYNSVFLIDRGQVQPIRYDKISLTPFGEVMPYFSLWPWLERQLMAIGAHGMAFDLTAGTVPRVFSVRSRLPDRLEVTIATPICFEATKTGLCRRLLAGHEGSPRILVNLTNDGWFGSFDAGRWQHLQVARWRAVELGVPVIRAANTGVSSWIDGYGRLIKAGVDGDPHAARVDGILIADVMPGTAPTIYARVGNVFGWSCLPVAAAVVFWSLLNRRPCVEPESGSSGEAQV